jgi:Outer membrane protein beta-barrel domain
MNLTQVDGDEIYGFHKAGFNIGPSAIIPFGKNKKWSVNLELLFSQKGSYQKVGPSDTTNEPRPYYKLRLDYVEVPVFVKFTDNNIISGGLGVSYAQLVNVKEIEHDSTTPTNLQSPYTLGDLQILADVQFRLWQRLWFDLRYSYSMYPIRTRHFKVEKVGGGGYDEWDRKQYNNVISLRLIYVFNQELQNKKGKNK